MATYNQMYSQYKNRSGIYKLESLSGKVYIGQSIDLYKRLRSHKSLYNYKKYPIQRALLKYGWETFKVEILVSFKYNKDINILLDILENFYINKYKSYNDYNILKGATGKNIIPESTRLKLSQSGKGRIQSEETRNKISKGHIGKKLSKDHIKKISESKKGNNYPKVWLRKPVIQLDLFDNFIKEWESITKASFYLKGYNVDGISKCASGKRNKYKQYKWKYKYEYL